MRRADLFEQRAPQRVADGYRKAHRELRRGKFIDDCVKHTGRSEGIEARGLMGFDRAFETDAAEGNRKARDKCLKRLRGESGETQTVRSGQRRSEWTMGSERAGQRRDGSLTERIELVRE